jgi:catalase
MTFRHAGAQPVYAPNSYGGPQAIDDGSQPTWAVEAAEIGRYAYEEHDDDDDFVQARALYTQVMSDTDREHLALNIAVHASDNVSIDVQRRVIEYWAEVDTELANSVAGALV